MNNEINNREIAQYIKQINFIDVIYSFTYLELYPKF